MVREGFCPVCVAAPFALAAGSSAVKKGLNDKNPNQTLYRSGGMGLLIFATALFFFERYLSGCKECSAGK